MVPAENMVIAKCTLAIEVQAITLFLAPLLLHSKKRLWFGDIALDIAAAELAGFYFG